MVRPFETSLHIWNTYLQLRQIADYIFFFTSTLLVIEVASGEYGDLNPVLFEAVQRGMCALEEKKNQCDSNNSSVCATMRQAVCVFLLKYNYDHIVSFFFILYQMLKQTYQLITTNSFLIHVIKAPAINIFKFTFAHILFWPLLAIPS